MSENKLEKRFDPRGWQWEEHGKVFPLTSLSQEDLLQVACACMESLERMEILHEQLAGLSKTWRNGEVRPVPPKNMWIQLDENFDFIGVSDVYPGSAPLEASAVKELLGCGFLLIAQAATSYASALPPLVKEYLAEHGWEPSEILYRENRTVAAYGFRKE